VRATGLEGSQGKLFDDFESGFDIFRFAFKIEIGEVVFDARLVGYEGRVAHGGSEIHGLGILEVRSILWGLRQGHDAFFAD
jgi:hypothetical protein